MDFHDHRGARSDGFREIFQMGPVRRADLDQLRARPRHDVGNAERAADFDQLAPGHGHFLAAREAVQRQHHGGGVVINDGRGLRPGQFGQLILDMGIPVAAPARCDIEFQIACPARYGGDFGDGFFRQGRAAQIGVQHSAGQVEHGFQAGRKAVRQIFRRRRDYRLAVGRVAAFRQAFPEIIECRPERLRHGNTAIRRDQRVRPGVIQQPVYRGKRRQRR